MSLVQMGTVRRVAALILACLAVGTSIAQNRPLRNREQTSFSAGDEGVKNPIPVPAAVLSLLALEDRVKTSMEDNDTPPSIPPQEWFSASVIHLGSSQEADLIVQAKGPLVGANIDTFWVILQTSKGPVVALTAPVHDLMVRRTRSNGYRDIEVFSATAIECSTTVLRFDGTKYEVFRSNSGPIPHC